MEKHKEKRTIEDNLISILFGRALRTLRLEKGFSGSQLAKMINISQQQLSRYERGESKITIDMVFKISVVLGVTIEEIYRYFIDEVVLYDVENSPAFTKGIFTKLL